MKSVAKTISSGWNLLRFVTRHPLNRNRKLESLRRLFLWQIRSRLARGPISVNFVNDARLLVSSGMTGATGNIYTGLHEFEDMSFVLHVLRKHDLFVDVGANIGSYTILAAAVVGTKSIAFEPIPLTYGHLMRNINLNGVSDVVHAENIGIGSEEGELTFTSGLDTVNHVVGAIEEGVTGISVAVKTLDEALRDQHPTVLKIDVEGYETRVIEGGSNILAEPTLLAVVMELNGSGQRYGFDESALHHRMLQHMFKPFAYSPFDRQLRPLDGTNSSSGNTIYIKDYSQVRARLESAPAFSVNGQHV